MLIRFGATLLLLLLLLIENPDLLVSPFYWLTSGLLLGGVTSEKLWKKMLALYLLLIIIVFVFTLFTGSQFIILLLPLLFMFFYLRTGKATRLGMSVLGLFTAIFPFFNSISYIISLFLCLFVLLVSWVMLYHLHTQQLLEEKSNGIEELSYEYKKLKRQIAREEDALKQAERVRIARDVHDSVGHQLTGLIMQLQMIEMKSSGIDPQISQAKNMAREALEDMRQAVRTMENEEKKGVPMIIQLIRKLEAESQTRISFTTKAGALSVSLTDEQSVSLYRFVQEGLTNAMRHAYAKRVDVVLHVAAEQTYVVTMTNNVYKNNKVVEGFGLIQLRQRFEHLGGSFRVQCTDGIFLVEGKFPLTKGE